VVTGLLLWLGMGHRSGRVPLLGRAAAFSERVSGLPGWTALPAGLATGSLIVAVFGMYWDISLLIANGRDEGPLANPAHYFILGGLFGVFSSGFLSMCLPLEKPSRIAVKLADGWYAPLGGVLIAAAGAFSLIGFPLDDVWHRLFGQDVTLWGPTHLMLIGGAAMTLVGLAVLFVEAAGANREAGRRGELPWARVEWYLTDEAAVPADDARSTMRLARDSLLSALPASDSANFWLATALSSILANSSSARTARARRYKATINPITSAATADSAAENASRWRLANLPKRYARLGGVALTGSSVR